MRLRLPLLLVLAAPPLTAGNVVVVGPGAPYGAIQTAVDAAVDGDVVLVRSGTYAGFQLVGRSVAVVADTGASVAVQGRVLVRNCTSPVLLAGLDVLGSTGSLEAERNALTASANFGALRVQDCRLIAMPPFPGGSPDRHGALVQDCPNVAITRSSLRGGDMSGDIYLNGLAGSSGLVARRSSVALHEGSLQGGRSTFCAYGYVGGDGGEGLRSQDSFVLAAGSDVLGGNGGQCSCADGGSAGYGVFATGAAAAVFRLGSTIAAGLPGYGNTPYQCPCTPLVFCCDCLSDGSSAAATAAVSGAQVSSLAATRRGLSGANVVRAGSVLSVECAGQPGDFVYLASSRTPRFVWRPLENGVSLVQPTVQPNRYRILGQVPASGVLQVDVAVPPLPVGVLGDVWHMQAIHDATAGTRHLSSPLTVVVVDPSI